MNSIFFSIPWLLFFFLLVFLSFPLVSGKNILLRETPRYLLLTVALVFFIPFRAYVFSDWIYYYIFYDKVPSLFQGFGKTWNFLTKGLYSAKELGFLLYAILCKTISGNYFFFQFASSIIDIAILYAFFKRYIPGKIILGFVFFTVFQGINIEFDLLRNSKGIMLFLISIKYLHQRKICPYMALNVLGMFFHVSSILYLPLYFVLHKKIPKPAILAVFVAGNMAYLGRLKWIKGLLLSVSGFIPFRLGYLVEVYLNSEHFSGDFGISLGYLERTFSFVVVFLMSGKLLKKNRENLIFLNCAWIYWFIYLYCSEMYIVLQRITKLFSFSYWLVFPQIYQMLSRQFKYVFLMIAIMYGTLRLGTTYRSYYYMYENILFDHLSYSQKRVLVEKGLEIRENAMNNLRHR